MIEVKKIPTSAEVYAVIWARHSTEFVPFGTYSEPEGTETGTARMYTEWGFKGSESPLMAIRTSWPAGKQDERTHEYWLFSVVGFD